MPQMSPNTHFINCLWTHNPNLVKRFLPSISDHHHHLANHHATSKANHPMRHTMLSGNAAYFAGVVVDTVNWAAHLSSGITQEVWSHKHIHTHIIKDINQGKWRGFVFLSTTTLAYWPICKTFMDLLAIHVSCRRMFKQTCHHHHMFLCFIFQWHTHWILITFHCYHI